MKRNIYFLLVLMALSFIGFNCSKNNTAPFEEVLTGIVVYGDCSGNLVCSITEGNIAPHKVVEKWTYNNVEYRNLFSVRNFCDVRGIEAGKPFKFTLYDKGIKNDCMVCMMSIPSPINKYLFIKLID